MPNKISIQDPAWAKVNTGDPQDTQILVSRFAADTKFA